MTGGSKGEEGGRGGREKGRTREGEENQKSKGCGGNLVQIRCEHLPVRFKETEEQTYASREPPGSAVLTGKGSRKLKAVGKDRPRIRARSSYC